MKAVRVVLHPAVVDSFQNQRRKELVALEEEFDLRIEVLADPSMSYSEDAVEWTARSVKERARAKQIEEAAVEAHEAVEVVEVVEVVEMTAPKRSRRRRSSRGRRRAPSSTRDSADGSPQP